ncbi:unnamed protein product [Auanema sp. JU1783]|nr:unnamed protein product [Auanema sp. JU1783]
MVAPLMKSFFLKGVLPLTLLFGAFLRPCFISIGYIIFAIVAPLLPAIKNTQPLPGSIRSYTIFVFVYVLLSSIGQISYQIYEAVNRESDQDYIHSCNQTDVKWLKYTGFIRFHGGQGFNSTRTILPEIVAAVASVLTLLVVNLFSHATPLEDIDDSLPIQPVRAGPQEPSNPIRSGFLTGFKRLSNLTIFVLAALVGCVQPSILNSVYFLAFLLVATWWAIYKPLRHQCYNKVKGGLLLYAAVHILLIYTYQIPLIQEWIPAGSFTARLIGLSPILQTSCDYFWTFWFNNSLKWPALANPFILLVFYHFLLLQLSWTKNGSRAYFNEEPAGSSVHEELLASDDEQTGDSSIPLRKVTSQVVDRHKISQIVQGERAVAGGESFAADSLVSVFFFVLYHAYVFPLFTIMTWALLYHSIFGLVLLCLGCVLWMFKDTRKSCFKIAAPLLTYVEFLLIVQYVCSMDLVELEEVLTDVLQMIGFIKAPDMDAAFVMLAVKLLLSLPVFLLLRLSCRERFYESLSEHERSQRVQSYGTFSRPTPLNGDIFPDPAHERRKSTSVFLFLTKFFTVYWIFVVAFVLLLVGLQSNPCLYTIGFFLTWCCFVLYSKVSLPFFRLISYVLYLFAIIYTSTVIITLYIYQFPGFPEVWIKWTGISKEWNDDIGLINYKEAGDSNEIITRLFWPLTFFAVAMLQLKFFHEPWLQMVNAVRGNNTEENNQENDGQATVTSKVAQWMNETMEFVWRLTEVHISRIVFIIIAVFVAKNICALYLPLAILISIGLCLPQVATNIVSLIMCAYLCVIALFKMVYQLKHVPDLETLITSECNSTQKFSTWFGVEKNDNTWNLLNGLIVAIIALVTQSVVVYRQRYSRAVRGEPEDRKKKVFPGFDMATFDHSIVHGLKFLIDHGFYKFGYEITIAMMAINAWVRMDMFGGVLCIWIVAFVGSKRAVCRRIWPLFVLYMAIVLPLQYALYVGLPEVSCIEYPWAKFFSGGDYSSAKNTNFDIWMGLSNFSVHWPSSNFVADFFLLLFASCQMAVFRCEGTDNDSIYPDDQYYLRSENPHSDFLTTQRSFVDFVKILVFHYGHWITLISTLVAGIGGTSLFALGYIVITLWILWQGNNLYVMNPGTNNFKDTLARWKILLFYTVFTMFFKVGLQIFGCVFLEWFVNDYRCWIRQIFSISCVNPIIESRGMEANLFDDQDTFLKTCPVNQQEAQMGFDAIALTFLVFQLRVFHSWFFQHCMVEYRSEIILANRGAVLKNQLIEKEMKEQNVQQVKKFKEIQERTQAIRERYNKQLAIGSSVFEPQTYGQAKRAGDYYMFDYDPHADELVQPVESFVPETDPAATQFDKLDLSQLVYTATSHNMDIGKTMEKVNEAEKVKDPEERMIEAISAERPEELNETAEKSSAFHFIKKLVTNTCDMISVWLNKMSREHRYVAFVLYKEKEKLKDSYQQSLSDTSLGLKDLRDRMDMPSLHVVHSEGDIDKMESEALNSWQQRSAAARLLTAIGNCILANTDIICYFLAVLAHAMGAGLITLPLPLMVFLWGTLSNPRPSKFFWVTMIAYTEFVILVKFICQFTFFEFNQQSNANKNIVAPLTLPKAFGIQRQDGFAMFDVPLLFALFFHRSLLRKFGLWKDANLTVTFNDTIQDSTIETLNEVSTSSLPTDGPSTSSDMTAEVVVAEERQTEEKKNPIVRFISQLFHPKFRYIRDLYPIMFGLDVIAFLIIGLGYSGFGEGGSGNVIGDIQKSRIPLTLVIMLIIMTLMIVVDRGLYLRKWVHGKLAYQLVIIVFIHTWIFFVLPLITKRAAADNGVAKFLYVVKCLYLLVSAWQIRNGYPQLCIGNLLTHAYGLANMVFFKIFMSVPFLFELRTAIDWTWTDTSMPLFDFFNMENFYALIYNLKCARTFEANYPAPRGQPKGVIVKYFMGLPMILLIVFLVWAPLLIFSLLNQIGDISIPDRVKMSMSLEGYPPLYQIEAQGVELRPFLPEEHQRLTDIMSIRFNPLNSDSLKRSRNSVAFLKDYSEGDILVVEFRPESEVTWPISVESLKALKSQLESNSSIEFQLSVEFSRPYDAAKKLSEKHSTQYNIKISKDPAERKKIRDALDGGGIISLPTSFPSYLLVPNEGQVSVPEPLVASILYDQSPFNTTSANVNKTAWFDTLTLFIDNSTVGPSVWVAQATHPTQFDQQVFFNASDIPYGTGRKYLQTVAFIDRAYPSFFAKYLQGGIITMYATLIILAGRVIRGLFTSSPMEVMISEIPNPDYLLKICLDIYLVREAKDFFLEQDLFAKLIFLFRSPATLIQWTRYKVKND